MSPSVRAKPLMGMLRTLAFGALAALGVVVWQLIWQGLFGPTHSFRAYAVLCACALPVFIAPSLRAALASLAITTPLGLCVLVLGGGVSGTLLGAALTVAVARAVMFRASPARSLVIELGLLVVSLSVALALGGGHPLALAVGIWSYCLVQSAYFVLLRPAARASEPPGDPFEVAHQRASALLDHRV